MSSAHNKPGNGVNIQRWAWTIFMSVFGVLLVAGTGAAAFVVTTQIDHERRISIGESELANTTKQLDRIEGKLDRLLEQGRP